MLLLLLVIWFNFQTFTKIDERTSTAFQIMLLSRGFLARLPLQSTSLRSRLRTTQHFHATTWMPTSHKQSPPPPSPSPPPLLPPSSTKTSREEIYADQDSTWVDRHLPQVLKPYAKLARVDRPIGTMLLLWPCWWSIGLAAPAAAAAAATAAATADFSPTHLGGLVGLFGVGAFVMRGAGCTINDMWDRKFDAQVERTLNRPLASGAITPFQALVFLGGQLTCGLFVLLQLNTYSVLLGASSLSLVILYPLMKRYTHFPQLVLGLTFNWGALLGWAAVHGSCDWHVVLPLYGAGVAWTLMYDTLYAHQDKVDDKKLGLKSTALYFGNEHTRRALYTFAGVSTTALAASGFMAGMSWPFYLGVVGAGCHMGWQINTADWDDRMNLNQRFVSNNHVGALVMAGIVAGQLV